MNVGPDPGLQEGPIQDSSAAAQPVVLMSIGVDLEDLHRTEVTENHDFLPHLPPDLPESPEGTGWGIGGHPPAIHWKIKENPPLTSTSTKNWEFPARLNCYRVDLPAEMSQT